MKATVLHGEAMTRLRELPDESVDSIVTDPPYELGFMGKPWDSSGISNNVAMWRECLRVLKPGGHLLSFGGSRTYHRMACAIEDAGFDIRDQIQWIYGSGFPKSLNISDGLGTALKPAHEPICMARKPLIGTVAANVFMHGTGALNIDACRIVTADQLGGGMISTTSDGWDRPWKHNQEAVAACRDRGKAAVEKAEALGRWPANVIHDGSDEVVSHFPEETGAQAPVTVRKGDKSRNTYGAFAGNIDEQGSTFHSDTGNAARFFYCAKASREERNRGCYDVEENTNRSAQNNHPTVKPVDLMRYLVRLVTPKGGTVLDPFTGSGSTGIAALEEGMDFIGIDREADYVSISRLRIGSVAPMFNTVEVKR